MSSLPDKKIDCDKGCALYFKDSCRLTHLPTFNIQNINDMLLNFFDLKQKKQNAEQTQQKLKN